MMYLNVIFLIILPIVSTTNNVEDIYSLETCNIPEEYTLISQHDFQQRYNNPKQSITPVVFRQVPINKQFLHLTQIDSILNRYGNKYITVTTANTYSYKKQHIRLNDYIHLQQNPSSKIKRWGNETLYWFGDDLLNDQYWLTQILRYYKSPSYTVDDFVQPSVTFGMGGRGTGVPFHFHGPGFQQMISGRKRWYLSAEKPTFDPNETTIQWALDQRWKTKQPFLYECTLNPGDLIFFPNLWWHATLNLDFAIFLSTFLSL
ncbi:unnamed protein product [Adineta ricciae]|uniref:JmjC domain-containing protein n=1 Tax=Adineta ricciae TaxID=249248 RepID=A0A816GU19_ADIRI|nr:unnamed protein product [Adineta ricciae]